VLLPAQLVLEIEIGEWLSVVVAYNEHSSGGLARCRAAAYVNAIFRSTNSASDDVASSDDANNDDASSIDGPSGDDASSNRDANDDDNNGGGNTGDSRRVTFPTRR
jgi:hypothetical protein